jgi:hypothetical protein
MIKILLFFIIILLLYLIFSKKYKKETFKQKRKFLLFSSIGKRATDVQALDFWTKNKNRNFDIVLYYYNEHPPIDCLDYCIYKKGTKFNNFYHFMNNHDISNYEAIWIVDDDIKMETYQINRMFNIFKEHNLDLAQPSYTENSLISHPMTKVDRKCKLRICNFVEVGSFLCSQKMINKCKDVFKTSISAFGLDYICCRMINNGNNIALIDETPCFHDNITSSIDNVIAREDHYKEAEELYNKYKIWPYKQNIYKKI